MDIATLTSPTTTLEVVNPATGDPIGISIELRSPQSDEVKAVTNKMRAKAMRSRRGQMGVVEQDKAGLDILVATVASWEWKDGLTFEGREPDDTDEFKRHVLGSDAGTFIVRQINEALQDEAAFMKA